MRKICFVCSGNTCRSPMAERLLKKHLKDLGVADVAVASMGLCVEPDAKVEPKAAAALKKYGINRASAKAKQISSKDLKKDILFITMTAEQKKAFGTFEYVFSIGELVGGEDVIDPYGCDQKEYDKTAKMLNDYTYKLAQILKQ